MASLTARRGLGARVAFIAVVMAVGLTPLSGSAHAPAALTSASFINQWASPTHLLADTPGGRPFVADDAPYKWSNGEIRFLLTRWDKQICDGSKPGDIAPSFTVVERDDPDAPADGLAVTGNVTVEDYKGGPPNQITQPGRLLRFTVADPAYPFGLGAGRITDPLLTTNTIAGGGAPYTVAIVVHHRNSNGVCNTTPVLYNEVIGIDRNLPNVPTITRPARLVSQNRGGWGGSNVTAWRDACETVFGPNTCGGGDRFSVALPQSGQLLVQGTASDPRTRPDAEDGNDYGFLETSGIKAVVVRLYSVFSLGTDPLGLCFGICPGAFIESFTQTNASCNATHILLASIPRCSESMSFSVDVTAAAVPGEWLAVDAYGLDLSGNRSAVASSQPSNPDNTAGPKAHSIAFLYLGS